MLEARQFDIERRQPTITLPLDLAFSAKGFPDSRSVHQLIAPRAIAVMTKQIANAHVP